MNTVEFNILSAVITSLKVAVICTVIGFPIAVSAGWVLARTEFIGKSLLTTFFLLPVALPPVVTGFLIMEFLGTHTWIGKVLALVGLPIPFTFAGAVTAALVVGLPFFIMGTRSAFQVLDENYEKLSHTLGHSWIKTFIHVTLPLALPGIAGGAVLAFARSLGEFGATAVVAGNIIGSEQTIALAVYTLMESPDGKSAIIKLSLLSLGISFVSVYAFDRLNTWQRERLQYGR